jgi:hypothetical protein
VNGCERVLARLTQGPATAAELYATTYTVVHSRISDLRRQGHRIEIERTGGTGAGSFVYRLVSSPTPGASCVDGEVAASADPAAPLSAAGSAQQHQMDLFGSFRDAA